MSALFAVGLLLIFALTGCQHNHDMRIQPIKGVGTIDWAVLNHDGSRIVMGSVKSPSGKEAIVLYDINDKTKQIIRESDHNMLCAAFHPIQQNILACCDSTSIALIDLETKTVAFHIPLEHGFIPGMAFSSDGTRLYVVHSYYSKSVPVDWDRTVKGPYSVTEIIEVDVAAGTVIDKLFIENGIAVGADFDMNNGQVGLRYMGGKCEIWSLDDQVCILLMTHIRGRCFVFLGDEYFMTSGCPPAPASLEEVILWDRKTGNQVRAYSPHSMAVSRMGVVRDKNDKNLILSGGEDQQACLWDVEQGKLIWRKRFRFFVGVGVSADGRRAVVHSFGDPLLLEF